MNVLISANTHVTRKRGSHKEPCSTTFGRDQAWCWRRVSRPAPEERMRVSFAFKFKMAPARHHYLQPGQLRKKTRAEGGEEYCELRA